MRMRVPPGQLTVRWLLAGALLLPAPTAALAHDPEIGYILLAAARRQGDYHCASAQWTSTEHRGPEEAKRAGQISAPAADMERHEILFVNGPDWRLDRSGQELCVELGHTSSRVRSARSVELSRDGITWRYQKMEDGDRKESGRISSPGPHAPVDLAVFAFLRPLDTSIFQQMERGNCAVVEDANAEREGCVTVALRGAPMRFWFDRSHGYVLTRQCVQGRFDLRIEYQQFPDFGYAPRGWNAAEIDSEGAVHGISSGSHIDWTKDFEDAEAVFAFKFPDTLSALDILDLRERRVR